MDRFRELRRSLTGISGRFRTRRKRGLVHPGQVKDPQKKYECRALSTIKKYAILESWSGERGYRAANGTCSHD
jgi:hypothetical protein